MLYVEKTILEHERWFFIMHIVYLYFSQPSFSVICEENKIRTCTMYALALHSDNTFVLSPYLRLKVFKIHYLNKMNC